MEIIGIYFLGTIVPRKYMPKISAVGLFCCDKFEETPNEKVSKLSKLSKFYFNRVCKHIWASVHVTKLKLPYGKEINTSFGP